MILVTGATGHVGRELVPQLLDAGQQVRVFTRDARKAAHLGDRVEFIVGDFDRPETLTAAMQNIDHVFLVTYETQQDSNALEAARRAGVQHVVKLSTLEANDAVLQIGKWHREREQLIEASGLAWTFLRPGMFMTNTIDWFADSIKRQGAVYFPGGKGKAAPIDPADIAAVAVKALTQPGHCGQAYALTGPELLSIGDMVQVIAEALDKPLKYTSIPAFAAKGWMLKSGMDKVLVNALLELLAALRKNKAAVMTDTVKQVTGRPARTFEAWCRENMASFQ